MNSNPYNGRITTDFSVLVEVNGQRMRFSGDGDGDARTGEVSVSVTTRDGIPAGFNPGLLSFALITGQPDIAARQGDIDNPFQHVQGEYHGIRRLEIEGIGHLIADYEVGPMNHGRRIANFHITGELNAPNVVSLEPTFEVWVPQGPGVIHGQFAMIWRTNSGKWMHGTVTSEYRLPTDQTLTWVHYRRIEFHLDVKDQSVRQSEKILLFAPETHKPLKPIVS